MSSNLKEDIMHRIVRTFAAMILGVTVAVLAGSGIAGAQEMEHGRTRPNTVRTADAIATVYVGYVRG